MNENVQINQIKIIKRCLKGAPQWLGLVLLCCWGSDVFATDSSLTLGGMASSITSSFTSLTKLITAGSYIAGLAFSIGAIMKFKAHKDNPTNIPIGTPLTFMFIAAALLFLPTILSVSGATLFGSSNGTTASPTGSIFS